MKTIRSFSAWMVVLGFCAMAGIATAQRDGERSRMRTENMEKTWKLQANAVAAALGISEADTNTLTEAYQNSRKDFDAGMRDATSGGGRGSDNAARIKKVRELRAVYSTNLTKAIGDLGGKDVAKAVAQLTVFDRVSDQLTKALGELKLDDSALQKAMALVGTYSTDVRKATEKAVKEEDFGAIRPARQELKTALDDGLSDILDETQLVAWKDKTQMRGRGGRGAGGAQGERGGRGGRGARGGRGSN